MAPQTGFARRPTGAVGCQNTHSDEACHLQAGQAQPSKVAIGGENPSGVRDDRTAFSKNRVFQETPSDGWCNQGT